MYDEEADQLGRYLADAALAQGQLAVAMQKDEWVDGAEAAAAMALRYADLTELLRKVAYREMVTEAMHEVNEVRCPSCNLRFAERQEYSCIEPGTAHNYRLTDAEEKTAAAYEALPRWAHK